MSQRSLCVGSKLNLYTGGVPRGSFKDGFDSCFRSYIISIDSHHLTSGRKVCRGKNKGRSMEGLLVKITKVLVFLFIVLAIVLNMGIF